MRRPLPALAYALVLLIPAAAQAQTRGVAHPWTEVDPAYDGKLTFRAVIEIPRGSKNKYEVDKPTGLLKLDRVLRSDEGYPADYGLIPKSYGDDHDPLDVVVLTSHPVDALTIVPVRAIGVMRMIDQGEGDDKIIAVNTGDPVYGALTNVSEVPKDRIAEITHFFATYKIREGKTVVVGDVVGPDEARKELTRAFADYTKLFATTKPSESEDHGAGLLSSIGSFLERAGTLVHDAFHQVFSSPAPAETRGLTGLLDDRVADDAAPPGADRDGR